MAMLATSSHVLLDLRLGLHLRGLHGRQLGLLLHHVRGLAALGLGRFGFASRICHYMSPHVSGVSSPCILCRMRSSRSNNRWRRGGSVDLHAKRMAPTGFESVPRAAWVTPPYVCGGARRSRSACQDGINRFPIGAKPRSVHAPNPCVSAWPLSRRPRPPAMMPSTLSS